MDGFEDGDGGGGEGEEERWGKEVVVIWKGEGMHVKNGV